MKISRHDSNMCYFDGQSLKYNKSERLHNIKHYFHKDIKEWKNEIKTLWNLDSESLDEICLIYDPGSYGFPNVSFKNNLYVECNNLDTKTKVWQLDHHSAHALSTHLISNKKIDIYFVIDGLGDDCSWSIFKDGHVMKGHYNGENSIGLEMYYMSNMLNIKGGELDSASKLMGLQSYGILDEKYLSYLIESTSSDMNVDISKIFDFDEWIRYKGDYTVAHLTKLNWSKTVHKFMESFLVKFFSKYANKNDVISYSGGVAQNVVWNTALKNHFPNILITPYSTDDGLSLGGIEWLRMKNNLPKFTIENFPYIQSDESPKGSPDDKTIYYVAEQLSKGKIVAWYQGNGEIGPRALGNRSLLMDPRIINGKDVINKIKKRENYRPFGASVLEEYQDKFFDIKWHDDYMLYVSNVIVDQFPPITHIDGTCRIQTVKENNYYFRKLLLSFYDITGCPILLNTSFNMAGKPICSTIEEALNIFRNTDIDLLVIGNDVYEK